MLLLLQVSLNFDPAKVFPGAETVLHLQAAPESLCSVGVVDKSVHVLGGNNQVSPAKVGIFSSLAFIEKGKRTMFHKYDGTLPNLFWYITRMTQLILRISLTYSTDCITV